MLWELGMGNWILGGWLELRLNELTAHLLHRGKAGMFFAHAGRDVDLSIIDRNVRVIAGISDSVVEK